MEANLVKKSDEEASQYWQNLVEVSAKAVTLSANKELTTKNSEPVIQSALDNYEKLKAIYKQNHDEKDMKLVADGLIPLADILRDLSQDDKLNKNQTDLVNYFKIKNQLLKIILDDSSNSKPAKN